MIICKMFKITACVNTFFPGLYKWQFIFFSHGLTQTGRSLREPRGISGLCINHSRYVTSLMFNESERHNNANAIMVVRVTSRDNV